MKDDETKRGYYNLKKETLAECLDHCALEGEGNWWFLPDIQRSFVWKAKATLQLIDSVFRGWPFGVLTVQTATVDDCVSIPFREFLRETGNGNEWSETHTHKVRFARDKDVTLRRFSLVLDGQQRLQSLLFAFADGQTGYVQTELEWMMDLWGTTLRKIRNRGFEVCPLAGMYVDFAKLTAAFDKVGRYEDIRYSDEGVICYAIADQDYYTPYYDRDVDWPFPVRKKDGKCLKLSKLWRFIKECLSGRPGTDLTIQSVRARLAERWSSDSWGLERNILETYGDEIASFALYVYGNVYRMEVGRVELEKPEGVGDEAFQRDVVEIFTRLNHGGKALTTAEITGAWLKNYWDYNSEKRGADVVITLLKEKCLESGFVLPDFMRYASALWTIAGDNCEQRKVIQNKDLTNVELLKNLAKWLSVHWNEISEATIDVARDFADKKWFLGSMGGMAFPLAVLVAFRMKVCSRVSGLNEKDKARFLQENLAALRSDELRFVACSEWSGYWTVDSIGRWGKEWQGMGGQDAENPIRLFDRLQEKISKRAIENFRTNVAADRSRVRQYYSYLLVWHRLNKCRYEAWMSNLESENLHVDHCLAYAKWLEILGEKAGEITVEKDQECRSLINSIGNCMLLNASTNIGKGKSPFRSYFEWLWEGNCEGKRQALGITEALSDPSSQIIDVIKGDIMNREKTIRSELEDFMCGKLSVAC